MNLSQAPVHLVWGEDPFLLRLAAMEIFGQGVQPREMDAGAWQGGETADLSTPSLFGGRRALLVTDAGRLTEDASRELSAYLSAPSPDATLVLSAKVGERGRVPARLVKLVQAVGEVREVKVARKDLPAWVARRAKVKVLELAPDAAGALVERLGEDPAALDQALDQLGSAFAGTRVTRALVAEQFRGLGDQHVWDLCDRAFAQDLPGAMRSLATLLQSGVDALPILGGIASRLRDLVRAAGLRFEWQARRYRESARRFSMDELVDIHDRIVEADRTLKSGATGDVVLPALVMAITGERAIAERS